MCMFDEETELMLPEEFDEEGNRIGPNCDGCGRCADFEDQ